ncbi:SDR family oxidoreductase [Nocardia yamanashiensis]|uniref:SDR family oxidoreductase n=1 Tax=Nocardia yamanashiensis TaxID=209247 RepID=UPI001E2F3724|nr:SDR family oxidoreductase [Nocardia yamanashiensis]UGT45193.1 SDR family oxidoreductase [Nocardia yamanashiensis]
MQVAVVGGTGTLGRPVVRELTARGHTVRVLSRSAPVDPVAGTTHHAVDLVTGNGLDEALEGVYAVVNAAGHRGLRSGKVLVSGVRTLLAAEQRARVGHHVDISIVGCERVPFSYYRTKTAQENVVTQGPIPWTLLRATQFHELLDEILAAAAKARLEPRGGLRFQPVDVNAVAGKLAAAVEAGPSGRVPDVGGPAVHTLTELARARRAVVGESLLALPIPPIGRVARQLRDAALCLGDDGEAVSFDYPEWLRRRYVRPGS